MFFGVTIAYRETKNIRFSIESIWNSLKTICLTSKWKFDVLLIHFNSWRASNTLNIFTPHDTVPDKSTSPWPPYQCYRHYWRLNTKPSLIIVVVIVIIIIRSSYSLFISRRIIRLVISRRITRLSAFLLIKFGGAEIRTYTRED